MGIIGFLAVLAFMIFPIFYGIRFLATKKEIKDVSSAEAPSNQIYSILLLGLSVAIVEQVVAYFIYYSNITLNFVFFFLVAALIGIISENKKEYVLKPSSLFTLILTLVFTLVFIVGAGLFILDGQRYAAEVSYWVGCISGRTNNRRLEQVRVSCQLKPRIRCILQAVVILFSFSLAE